MWDRSRAAAAIHALDLRGHDYDLASYWLNLWTDSKPPTRERFEPRALKGVLPGLALVEFFPEQGPVCRLAGTAIEAGLGRSLKGTNLLFDIPESQRPLRSARLKSIVEGSISRSITTYTSGTHRQRVSGIQLPLFGTTESGSQLYLVHTNWRPDAYYSVANRASIRISAPDEYLAVSIADGPSSLTSPYPAGSVQIARPVEDANISVRRHLVQHISLDEVRSPLIRKGISYWRQLRGARQFPTRQEIGPHDIKDLLRNTMLLRVIGNCEDYDFRILGDAHVQEHGFRTVPRRLSQIDQQIEGYSAILKALYDPVVRSRHPYAMRGVVENTRDFPPYVKSECAFLPIGPDENRVDHVLNFTVYQPSERFFLDPPA